jgi:hypothetical protein
MKLFTLLASIFFVQQAIAQLPETSIYLINLERQGNELKAANPKLISKPKGYNNQPYFTPDDEFLYFVSSMDTSNVEIMRVNLLKKRLKVQRVTKSKEPEYSPKLTPDPDFISCVRVEKDDSTQHLAIYSKKGKATSIVLPELKKVGYYEWVNQNEFISFELPEPFYLVKHTISTNKVDTLAQQIGRTFYYQSSKSRLLFVDKSDSAKWLIRSFDNEQMRKRRKGIKEESTIISETLSKEEDYCVMMDGSILMGQNGILYIKKNPFKNLKASWQKVADLKSLGIKKFTRIAISADNTRLAIVGFNK